MIWPNNSISHLYSDSKSTCCFSLPYLSPKITLWDRQRKHMYPYCHFSDEKRLRKITWRDQVTSSVPGLVSSLFHTLSCLSENVCLPSHRLSLALQWWAKNLSRQFHRSFSGSCGEEYKHNLTAQYAEEMQDMVLHMVMEPGALDPILLVVWQMTSELQKYFQSVSHKPQLSKASRSICDVGRGVAMVVLIAALLWTKLQNVTKCLFGPVAHVGG